MLDLKRVRPLDAVIAVVVVAVVVIGGFLGYIVWAQNQAEKTSTPAARAIAQVSAEVRAKPNDLDARMRLAQAYAVAGQDDAATEQYKAALKIQKDFSPALSGLGFIALKQKQYATGQGYFQKVVDLRGGLPNASRDPQLEIALFYLGTAQMEQRNYEDAASSFKRALSIRRDASDTHYQLAVVYQKLGVGDKYREELENTLLFDPKMAEANYDYGKLLLADGDRAGAAEHFSRSAESAPGVDKPVEALEELGPFEDRLAQAKKLAATDPAAALVEARIAVALEPEDVEALVLAGKLAQQTGDKERAEKFYRRVMVIEPQNADAQAGLKQVTDGK